MTACLAKDPGRRPTARDAQHRLLGTGAPHPAAAANPAAFAAASSSMGQAEVAEPPAPAGPAAKPGPASASASTPTPTPTPTVPGPRQSGKWLRRPVPVAAGAVVGALLVGLPLWAATRNDGDGGGSAQQRRTAPLVAPGSNDSLGGTNAITPGGSTTPAGQAPSEAAGRGGSSRPSSAGSASATPAPKAPRPGDTPAPNRRNPYTAPQVCDSGGHGGGYYVQRSSRFNGGATYQLYNSSGYNCVVTLKTANVGQKTTAWARLKRQSDGKSVTDSGSFSYYAGPVFLSAKGTCVAYAGGTGSGSTSASWANCG